MSALDVASIPWLLRRMVMSETVSIIVPVYNAARCISDTIMSVNRQTYDNWELWLVDDGSTDGTVDIMKQYESDKIHVVSNSEGKGAASARNLGTSLATGRYIAFLDADDLWKKDKLEKQIAFMQEKGSVFSFTGYEFADENAVGLGTIVKVPAVMKYKDAIKNTTIFTSTVIFDMAVLSKEDIHMPNVVSEDSATWWQVLKKGHVANGLDEALTLYRRMGKSLSSNKLEAIRRIWFLYRKVEHLNLFYSAYCFCHWAVRAVYRRV